MFAALRMLHCIYASSHRYSPTLYDTATAPENQVKPISGNLRTHAPSTFLSCTQKVDANSLIRPHFSHTEQMWTKSPGFPSTFSFYRTIVGRLAYYGPPFSHTEQMWNKSPDFRPHSLLTEQMWTDSRISVHFSLTQNKCGHLPRKNEKRRCRPSHSLPPPPLCVTLPLLA